MSRISVLMTVYNEADFVEYAIRSCLPHVDDLVIVEGAYQETIACGAEPRSTDGTVEICKKHLKEFAKENLDNPDHTFTYIEVNAQTDKDQRNIGLEKIKELNPDGWLLIIDGDEVYDKTLLNMVKVTAHNMERGNQFAAYFKSLTFVNDLRHYTEQEFPRLFKLTPECKFVNDNFMEWPDENLNWFTARVIKKPQIRYHHYAFCKDSDHERFQLKKDWWESRFGDKKFEYDWYVNEKGEIWSPNHRVIVFTGRHPEIMEQHPKWKKEYSKGSNV